MSKKQSTKKTGKSFSSRGKVDSKSGNNGKSARPSGKISASQRKKTKIQVAKINADVDDFSVLRELGQMDSEEQPTEVEQKKALNIQKLMEDEKRDKKVREQIESEKKETNNDMLKQLELISGFSL